MSENDQVNLSFRHEGVVKGALTIVITANTKGINGVDVVDKYRIICWKKHGKTYFNLDIMLTSLEVVHSQLFFGKEEVFFDKKNKLDYFIRSSDSVRFQRLPNYVREYLKENLFHIMKGAPEEKVAR